MECVTAIKFKMSQYFEWDAKMSHFQHHSTHFLCSVVNKIWVNEIYISLAPVIVYVFQTLSPDLCGNGVIHGLSFLLENGYVKY